MRGRIEGLFVIVRALGPIILAVILVLASWSAVGAVTESAEKYSATVSANLSEAKAMFDRVGEGLGEVGRFVSGVSASITSAFNDIADLPVSIPIGIPQVTFPEVDVGFTSIGPLTLLSATNLDITIPGAAEVREFFAEAAAVGRNLTSTISEEVSALVQAPRHITEISTATGVFAGELRSAVVGWLRIVIGSLLVAALMWFGFRASSILNEVRRGWRMMRGAADAA